MNDKYKEILNIKFDASDDKKYSLKDFDKEYLVIYFYPKDNTPYCTIQGTQYTNNIKKFNKNNIDVVGVSAGPGTDKVKFSCKCDYKHILLADEDYILAKYFGSYAKKGLPKFPMFKVRRYTYILNKARDVILENTKVNYLSDSADSFNFITNYKKENDN